MLSSTLAALIAGLPAAILFAAAVYLAVRSRRAAGAGPARRTQVTPGRPSAAGRVMAFGGAWMLLGWMPLFAPGLGWHPYYTLLGSMGVWLAASAALSRHAVIAATVVAAIVLLRPARVETPQVDLGSEWYQRRTSALLERLRVDLLRQHPRLPRHSRVFFANVPGGLGLIAGPEYCAPLRVWYWDRTLRGWFFSYYRSRAPADTLGGDYFFSYSAPGVWLEVVKDREDIDRLKPVSTVWESTHIQLLRSLIDAGDIPASRVELEKLTAARPNNFEYAHDLGQVLLSLGDTTTAGRWFEPAASLPGATAAVVEKANRFRPERARRRPNEHAP